MTTSSPTARISRREVMQGGAGAGIVLPAFQATPVAMPRQPDPPAAAGHPAIGLWTGLRGGYAPAEYYLIHADGTGTFYSRFPRQFSVRSDRQLPVSGFLLWRPVDDLVMEAVLYLAWGDASLDTHTRFRQRWTVDETGDTAMIEYRGDHLDYYGNPVNDPFIHLDGEYEVERKTWEPFEDEVPATPQATPVT